MPDDATTTPIQRSIVTVDSEWPPKDETNRLNNYDYFKKLFLGRHYEAFREQIKDGEFNKAYSKLRWIQVNFAGLISRIVADMLFSEPVTVKMPEGGDQEFIDGLWESNKMHSRCYQSALGNSYNGDAVFKVRIGPSDPTDPKSPPKISIESVNPRMFFPKINEFNVDADMEEATLGMKVKIEGKDYVRLEIHTRGKIVNELYLLEGSKIKNKENWSSFYPDIDEFQDTKVDELLVIHIPNWKTDDTFYGYSDYIDLDSLFYAINNRITKVDNILDKHSDPILLVPTGVIDENGRVKKSALGVIEVGPAEDGKPEYVVWDASLENAFKQLEKLVEFLYMIGEVSPDVLGLGQGVSDSGRALKYKLIRTIAKTSRKKMYYNYALRQTLYVAQKAAKAWGAKIENNTFRGEVAYPDLRFADGLPTNYDEAVITESSAIDAGLTSRKAAIQRVYEVDEKTAGEMVKEIDDEKPTITMPTSKLGQNPGNPGDNSNSGNSANNAKV